MTHCIATSANQLIRSILELTGLKWDTYRTLYPLMSLHDPETFSRIVRGMIDIQKHEGRPSRPPRSQSNSIGYRLGWLPECRGATAMHFIQGGSSK